MESINRLTINWAKPSLSRDDFYALEDCFDLNWISQGNKVKRFESVIAINSNREYCIAVNSGSSALMALLLALGISKEAEIIIPGMSFIALPHIVTILGALPVLADIDDDTGMLTKETVLPCITNKTAAIIGIDYSGFANDWTDLASACDEFGINLIIDSASSFLATNNGRPAGSYGKASIFSFHSAKTITTGEGGAIVTDDKHLAKELRQIRNHGEVQNQKYVYNLLGSNFRMTDIAASLGISQISRKEEILNGRNQRINDYLKSEIVRKIALTAYTKSNCISNGFTFTVLCDSRDKIKNILSAEGIETRVMWPYCVDRQPVYQKYRTKLYKEITRAQYFSEACLSLPVHLGMTKKDIERIVMILEKSINL